MHDFHKRVSHMAKEISAAKMRFSVVSKQDKALFSSLLPEVDSGGALPSAAGPLALGEKSKSINQPFRPAPRVVSPADALGNRARGLERELKASGRYIKMRRSNSKSFCL
jgi:hypothetical protein